jgi:alpha-N-arabinofuranosidase
MDGLYAAGMFHVFQRNCDVVTMTNFCDITNQLPAIVTNQDGGLYLNPIYHAFYLYTNHTGNIVLHSEVEVASYNKEKEMGVKNVPFLDCSVTLFEENGNLAVAVINRHKEKAIETEINIKGFKPKHESRIYVLNAPEVTTANDFDEPDNVILKEEVYHKAGEHFTYAFPAHSVTVFELEAK